MQVNGLPDDCLIAIFDRLSVTCLYYARSTCTRWRIIITRDISRRRTELSIYNSNPQPKFKSFIVTRSEAAFYGLEAFDIVTRYVDWEVNESEQKEDEESRNMIILDHYSCLALVELFPRITKFTFVEGYAQKPLFTEKNLAHLLTQWEETLSDLTLIGHFYSKCVYKAIASKLPHLKILTINQSILMLAQYKGLVNDLEEIYCIGANDMLELGAVGAKRFLGESIKKCGFYEFHYYPDEWKKSNSHRLTRVLIRTSMQLNAITATFTSLTKLQVAFGYVGRLREAINKDFQRLPNLAELIISAESGGAKMVDPDIFRGLSPLPQAGLVFKLRFGVHPHSITDLIALLPNAPKLITFSVLHNDREQYINLARCDRGSKCPICKRFRDVLRSPEQANFTFKVKQEGVVKGHVVERVQADWMIDLVRE